MPTGKKCAHAKKIGGEAEKRACALNNKCTQSSSKQEKPLLSAEKRFHQQNVLVVLAQTLNNVHMRRNYVEQQKNVPMNF